MPGPAHSLSHPVPHGDFPMIDRLLAALDRLEDNPLWALSAILGLFTLTFSLLAINEAGVR